MTNNSMKDVLEKLGLEKDGTYKNGFYIINLEDSNEYAKMFTQLCDNAVHTESPSIGVGNRGATEKITNYFEIDSNDISYNIFLVANFTDDTYLIRIGEK